MRSSDGTGTPSTFASPPDSVSSPAPAVPGGMRSRLIELLKADIESYELQPFTTPHLSRIAQKEQELLALLEEKNHPVAAPEVAPS